MGPVSYLLQSLKFDKGGQPIYKAEKFCENFNIILRRSLRLFLYELEPSESLKF